MVFIDIIAAFFMGALSGMGIGGGGLLVIYLTLIRKISQLSAQGLNLYFFIFASAAALFVHCIKRKINYPLVLLFSAVGMPAALMGSLLAQGTDPNALRIAFGTMLILAGGISLFRTLPNLIKRKK